MITKVKASITDERMAALLRCVDVNVDRRGCMNNVDRRGRLTNVVWRGRVNNVDWRGLVNERVGEGSPERVVGREGRQEGWGREPECVGGEKEGKGSMKTSGHALVFVALTST
jgi:hypothetical protein